MKLFLGFDGESDSSVISTHIKNIRSKLTAFQLAPIETVWGVGYKWAVKKLRSVFMRYALCLALACFMVLAVNVGAYLFA